MIDVKKLVFGFLILAVAGTASTLMISSFAGAAAVNATAITSANVPQTSPVGTNAFLPQNSDDATDATTVDPALATTTVAAASDPNNLTNLLAESYLTNLMTANPDGPEGEDSNGNPIMTAPNPDDVLSSFANGSAITNLTIPDWDVEADQIPITVSQDQSSSTLSSYGASVEDILNQDIVQTNLESLLDGSADPGVASYATSKVQAALQDIAGLQPPQVAVPFQKSMLTMLVYDKNTLALVENDSVDPIKTALILQGETGKYNSALQDFANQFQQVSALKGFVPLAQAPTPPPNKVVAFVDNALGIQTAHAIFGLGDIDFDPTIFGQTLLQYAQNIALQIAKNIIIGIMQREVLHWVQGNGVPKFIQNWGTTFVNAYTQAAINALNAQFACVNPAFSNQLKILVPLPNPNSTNAGVCAVQFSRLLTGSNLTNFYNKFSSGGFVSYMTIFQPGGNLFGSAIDAQDVAMNAGGQAQQSAQTKSVAQQGWTGQSVCLSTNGGSVISPITGCKPGDLLNGADPPMCAGTGGKTYAPVAGAGQGDGSCPGSGYNQTTLQPGQVTGQVFNSAVDSSGKLTAAANDIAGLLDAFLSSLLNSIATDVITTTSGALINAAANAGSGGGNTQGGVVISSSTGATSVNLTCNVTGNVGVAGTFIFSAVGGQTITAGGVATTPSYKWQVTTGVGNPMTGTGSTFETSFAAPGTYNVLLTDTTDNVTANCPATF